MADLLLGRSSDRGEGSAVSGLIRSTDAALEQDFGPPGDRRERPEPVLVDDFEVREQQLRVLLQVGRRDRALERAYDLVDRHFGIARHLEEVLHVVQGVLSGLLR